MAGRVPQRFIDDLLDRVDIVDVISARLDLRKTGKNHSARCPFHDEKTPSFSVNPEKQFFYCFGCGAGGNAIGFVMDYDRVDFPRAIETLANLVGMEVPSENLRDKQRDSQRKGLYDVLDQASRFYRDQLRQHPNAGEAVNYLRQRGLSGEIARDFGIGYAPPGWDNLLSCAQSDELQIDQMTAAGLLVVKEEEHKIYDRFRHRIMFPIRDSRGRTIAFGGRVLGDDKPKYLNSPETPVFHKGRELYGLYEANRAGKNLSNLLVVEGYMDVVALAQHGISNAVATLGTATSVEHLEKLFRYTSEVVFCFDGDEAGRKAGQRAMETCLPTLTDGRSCKFLFLTEGEDPDTLIRKLGAEGFNKLLADAMPLSTFLFNTLQESLDLGLPDNRAKLSQRAAPLINRIPHGVFQRLMLDQLAEKTGLASDTLRELVMDESTPPPWDSPPPGNYEYDERQTRRTLPTHHPGKKVKLSPVHWLIALLAHNPRLTATIDEDQCTQLRTLELPGMDTLLPLIKVLREHPEYTLNHLLGYWRGIHGAEQGEQLARMASTDLATAPGNTADSARTQVEDILSGLLRSAERELPVEQQIARLAGKPQLDDEDRKIALTIWQNLTAENARQELIVAVKQLLTNYSPTKK